MDKSDGRDTSMEVAGMTNQQTIPGDTSPRRGRGDKSAGHDMSVV